MAISCKGAHFPQEIILMGVRWDLAYPLSYRYVEAWMEARACSRPYYSGNPHLTCPDGCR
jgi:transposase-like protein